MFGETWKIRNMESLGNMEHYSPMTLRRKTNPKRVFLFFCHPFVPPLMYQNYGYDVANHKYESDSRGRRRRSFIALVHWTPSTQHRQQLNETNAVPSCGGGYLNLTVDGIRECTAKGHIRR
jgi:hypothetical protein